MVDYTMSMSKLSIEENIKTTIQQIENMTREILRLEGSVRVFQQLKEAGVEDIEVDAEKIKELQKKIADEQEKQLKGEI
jgi:hypothetical protein